MALADQSERVRKQRRQPAVGSFPAWREVAVPALGRAVLDRSRVLSFARERSPYVCISKNDFPPVGS